MVYLSHGTDRLSEEELGKTITEAFPETGGAIMQTLAEKWFQQGETKGKIEGLLEGIELNPDSRFGNEGLKILPEILRIQDIDLLKRSTEARQQKTP